MHANLECSSDITCVIWNVGLFINDESTLRGVNLKLIFIDVGEGVGANTFNV